MKNWILKPVRDPDYGYVLLVFSEYDTFHYHYRYISKLPKTIEKLLALAYIENSQTWLGAWFENLKDDDNIIIYNKDLIYKYSDIKQKVLKLIEAAS